MTHSFHEKRILLIGDVMLDRYIYGKADRLSPEAPVPVLHAERTENRLGGVGTVLRNLCEFRADVVFFSAVGDDSEGDEVIRLVGDLPRVTPYLQTERRVTSVKTRHIAGHHQISRVDVETIISIQQRAIDTIMRGIEVDIPFCDIVILSDYGKGVLRNDLPARIIECATWAGKPVVVDSKSNDLQQLRGATVFTPNLHELYACTGLPVETRENIIDRCREIINTHGIENVLATCGKDGMILQTRDNRTHAFEASAREVFDVTGAGDTVVAILALAMAAGIPLPDAARLANAAAGIAVGRMGSATVTPEDLARYMMEGVREAV